MTETNEKMPPARVVAFLIVALGVALSFAGAVRPHFGSFHLHAGLLILGMIPYLLYAVLTQFLKGGLLVGIGVLILLTHLALWLR